MMYGVQRSTEFVSAFHTDYEELDVRIRRRKDRQKDIKENYGYHLPIPYGHCPDVETALIESFAQLFAIAMGRHIPRTEGLHIQLPRSFKFMQEFTKEFYRRTFEITDALYQKPKSNMENAIRPAPDH